MKVIVFVLLLFLSVNLFSFDYPKKKGDYASSYPTQDMDIVNWLSGFSVVEFGGVGDTPSSDTLNFLKSKGAKVLAYDWMPATYYYLDGENDSLANWTYQNRYYATINPDGPYPHTEEMGYSWAREYYFDYGEQSVINKRVNFEINFVLSNHFNGIFYDWGSGNFINDEAYSAIKSNFENKHPDMDYLDTVTNFYRKVREMADLNNLIIFTNQGYRTEDHVLPFVDYDMAESYIVGYDYFGKTLNVEGYGEIEVPETQYFPVSFEGEENFYNTLNYLDTINELIKRYAGKHFKKFVFMDYAAPVFVLNPETGKYMAKSPKNAIFLSFATAKLINQTSYLEVPFDKKLEFNEVYFVNLGKPFEDNYTLNQNENYAIRYFENGFVITYFGNETEKTVSLSSRFIPKNINFLDLFSNTEGKAEGNTIILTIKTGIDPLTGKTIPAGRVIMYEKIHRIKPVEPMIDRKSRIF